MNADKSISDTLAERYCDMLDVLNEVDLAALETRIERLIRLRDTLRVMRAEPTPAPEVPAPREDTPVRLIPQTLPAVPAGRRPRGHWPSVIRQAIEAYGRPMTIPEIRDWAVAAGLAGKGDRGLIAMAIAKYRLLFRRAAGDPTSLSWELVTAGPDRQAS